MPCRFAKTRSNESFQVSQTNLIEALLPVGIAGVFYLRNVLKLVTSTCLLRIEEWQVNPKTAGEDEQAFGFDSAGEGIRSPETLQSWQGQGAS